MQLEIPKKHSWADLEMLADVKFCGKRSSLLSTFCMGLVFVYVYVWFTDTQVFSSIEIVAPWGTLMLQKGLLVSAQLLWRM